MRALLNRMHFIRAREGMEREVPISIGKTEKKSNSTIIISFRPCIEYLAFIELDSKNCLLESYEYLKFRPDLINESTTGSQWHCL